MTITEILLLAAGFNASDIHLAVGNPPMIRLDGILKAMDHLPLTDEDTIQFAKFLLSDPQFVDLGEKGQVDLAYRVPGRNVYRINVFRYSDHIGLACRIISDRIQTIRELDLPETIEKVTNFKSGLVLVTGPTGCGKSTTIAAIIEAINCKKNCHILTIEDPIEYIFKNKKSLVTQREVGRDCSNFSEALRAGLRQDPDVIMLGELRDLETITTAVTAAETGHLVLATLHTRNAYQTIERIIDVFPSQHQQQIRVQLANSLMAVFSQRLLPRKNNVGRVASVESLIVTPAIRNLIRENKVHQLYTFIQTGQKKGMQTMDDYLKTLYKNDTIDRQVLLENVLDREALLKENY